MNEKQFADVTARLDDIAGMHMGLMQALTAVFACLTPELRERVKTHLPAMDEALETVRLNSGFQDRTLEVAQQAYQRLTSTLR